MGVGAPVPLRQLARHEIPFGVIQRNRMAHGIGPGRPHPVGPVKSDTPPHPATLIRYPAQDRLKLPSINTDRMSKGLSPLRLNVTRMRGEREAVLVARPFSDGRQGFQLRYFSGKHGANAAIGQRASERLSPRRRCRAQAAAASRETSARAGRSTTCPAVAITTKRRSTSRRANAGSATRKKQWPRGGERRRVPELERLQSQMCPLSDAGNLPSMAAQRAVYSGND